MKASLFALVLAAAGCATNEPSSRPETVTKDLTACQSRIDRILGEHGFAADDELWACLASSHELRLEFRLMTNLMEELSGLEVPAPRQDPGHVCEIHPCPACGRRRSIGDFGPEPKIAGRVEFVGSAGKRFLLDVGLNRGVEIGMKFTVHKRAEIYVSRLVVERVGPNWSLCRELEEFRKRPIEEHDDAATRVFD